MQNSAGPGSPQFGVPASEEERRIWDEATALALRRAPGCAVSSEMRTDPDSHYLTVKTEHSSRCLKVVASEVQTNQWTMTPDKLVRLADKIAVQVLVKREELREAPDLRKDSYVSFLMYARRAMAASKEPGVARYLSDVSDILEGVAATMRMEATRSSLYKLVLQAMRDGVPEERLRRDFEEALVRYVYES